MGTKLGKEMRQARLRMGLTAQQVGDAAGVTRSWLAQVETGRIAQPDHEKLERIAPVLGLDLERMLALSDQLGEALRVRERQAQPGVVTDAGLAAAIERQTNVLEKISAVLDGLVARVAELGTIQGAQTHALESMLTEFPAALAAGLALQGAQVGAGTRSPDEAAPVGVK